MNGQEPVRTDTALDSLLPAPRLVEIDRVDLDAPPEEVWKRIRHGDLAPSPLIRALFAIRTRGRGKTALELDDLRSTPERPGFQLLIERVGRELAVGAVGKVWEADIPFVHVADAAEFAAFDRGGFAKVAWAIRLAPRDRGTHLELEVRVETTDEESWPKFRRYFFLIGIGSRLIRRLLLRGIARDFGALPVDEDRALPGDDLLPGASAQLTDSIDIAAKPESIWPWLVQMGCRRAGWYSYDLLDNAGSRSAREIHPELQSLSVGDVLPATPAGDDGFEVLRVEPPRLLVLGALFDADSGAQLAFVARRPRRYSQIAWAFVLEPLDGRSSRLTVRVRTLSRPAKSLLGVKLAHRFMEAEQLRQLAARAEGRLPLDDWHDVLAGAGGAAEMTLALLTPFLRERRSRWGVSAETAARSYPGDELVPAPRWSWTHGVEIDAPASEVWPWVAQIGADRGGFYSYQWLENLAGCETRNAEVVHPEWEVRAGDRLVLHPEMPALPVVACEPGRWFVAFAARDERASAEGRAWATVSWLFHLHPLETNRCRLVSRYRVDCSDDLPSKLRFGPAFAEPVGFAMDRRLLTEVKDRAERSVVPVAG